MTAAVVVPAVDAAVEQDITHSVVPSSPITGLGVKFINELLLNKIQTELATANYGTTASEHYAQIQEMDSPIPVGLLPYNPVPASAPRAAASG